MKSKRFSRSFRPIVELKEGEMCSWRRHYRGALRNLIGILNLWASNDPDRFVYAGLEAIVKNCKRYKGKGYSRSAVLAALRELRGRQHIVSNLVTCTRFGYETSGFSVAAHDTLCVREGNRCVFRGTDAPLVWNSTPENALPIALQNAHANTLPSAHDGALKSALPCSPQDDEPKKLTSKNAPITVLTASTELTASATPANPTPVTGAAKNGSGMAGNGLAVAFSSQSFTAEEENLWREMRDHDDFPEEMMGAIPRLEKGEKRKVVDQLKAHGVEVVVKAIENWEDKRDMTLCGLSTKWRAWLEEGKPFLRREAENA